MNTVHSNIIENSNIIEENNDEYTKQLQQNNIKISKLETEI